MKTNKKLKDYNNRKINNLQDSELHMKSKSKDLKLHNKNKSKESENKNYTHQILNWQAKTENLLNNLEMLKETMK